MRGFVGLDAALLFVFLALFVLVSRYSVLFLCGCTWLAVHESGPTGTSVVANWTFQTNGPVQSSPAIGSDGTVYIGSSDQNFYGMLEFGITRFLVCVWFTCVFFLGFLPLPTPAIDGNTGVLKWAYKTGGPITSSPYVSLANNVYFGSSDNNVYALAGTTGKLLWQYNAGAPVTQSFVLYLLSGVQMLLFPAGKAVSEF